MLVSELVQSSQLFSPPLNCPPTTNNFISSFGTYPVHCGWSLTHLSLGLQWLPWASPSGTPPLPWLPNHPHMPVTPHCMFLCTCAGFWARLSSSFRPVFIPFILLLSRQVPPRSRDQALLKATKPSLFISPSCDCHKASWPLPPSLDQLLHGWALSLPSLSAQWLVHSLACTRHHVNLCKLIPLLYWRMAVSNGLRTRY